jgi:phospholipase C
VGFVLLGGWYVEISNRTDKTVWVGLYNLQDTVYWATMFPWGARKKLEQNKTLSVDVSGARVQVVFWTTGAFGSVLAAPKAVFTSGVSIASDGFGTYVYNHLGAPRPVDKIDHVFVLMLENRSFDNLLGWLYAPSNKPPRNIPAGPGGQTTYEGLTERAFSNTRVAMEHDTAPESQRIYAGKVVGSDRKPDPNPREVCPSFIEQMFGTETPSADATPNMWGFVQNYAGKKGNNDVPGIMECFTPDQVPVLRWLAKTYAIGDRWFGSLPSETWPNRSFVHAGTSFGRLNNCDGAQTEECIPNFLPYAGKRTIFDVLDEQSVRWGVYQDALVVGTLTSTQFWTIPQKLGRQARNLDSLAHSLDSSRPPQYVFIEPSYGVDPNDQHPPHKVSSGERLLRKVYEIVSKSPIWNRSVLIITYDEHGGCYDHVPPPTAPAPDTYPPQFAVSGIDPFKQYGPRVPAVVVSPYIESGTVFRERVGAEFDHTSILASLRDWIFVGKPDLLGANARIQNAPVIWDLLSRTTPRPPENPPAVAPELPSPLADGSLTAWQREVLALSEAERRLVDEAALGDGNVTDWEARMMELANSLLAELEDVEHPDDLPAELRDFLALSVSGQTNQS